MNRVDLYIGSQAVDFFDGESIELNMSVQNIKDISKVFGDFSKSFTLPASPANNAVFKHYYNVDVSGGFQANLRTSAFIEVNNNVLRSGVIELESVQLKNLQPYAYKVSFYSTTTSLKDLFGEDTLNDLDLSAQDHSYNDTNIEQGINSYVSGTGDAIIYPMITPVARWYFDSQGSHGDGNIHYHNDPDHGVFYYDLKPAVKLQKILDAIETKYGVTFNSDLFDSADFGKLFMWCHRRAGYMFKDQPNGTTDEALNFTSATGSGFNTTTDTFTFNQSSMSDMDYIDVAVTSTDNYAISLYVNGELFAKKEDTGNSTVRFITNPTDGDEFQIRFSPIADWDASVIDLTAVTASFVIVPISTPVNIATASTSATQTYSADVIIADQMPEQKVVDFFSSIVKMFNLVIVPTSSTAYDIEPLDDWYAEGTTREITNYTDITETEVARPELYKRISYSYNETEAILGEQYRLQNDIGYGDLRADFAFDGDEFDIEVGFDNMLFERLTDVYENGVGLTELNVGQCITREQEPYIGNPFIFYASGNLRVALAYHWSYNDMNGAANEKQDMWLIGNVNSSTADSVTQTINFGTEIDPYLLQGFGQSLYSNYWKDYITDLYDTSRRLFKMRAILPYSVMLSLKANDKLTILERNYIINQVTMNLATGEAQLELLNDV